MNILQIATGFPYSSLYKNLFKELSDNGIKQSLYIPLHDEDTNNIYSQENFEYPIYANKIIKKADKLFYFARINRMTSDIEKNYDIQKFSKIHAHSLYSDGAVAYELFKKYKIPYIVAIRDTDINKYYKLLKHLKKYAREILNCASNIIFISEAYKETLFLKYEIQDNSSLINKSVVIPNGIEDFWHKKFSEEKEEITETIKLLFVGKINKRKNLKTVLEVAADLQRSGEKVLVEVVGDGILKNKLKKKYSEQLNIKFRNNISDRHAMRSIYLSNDILVVPSFTETFGLVYAEAMSCGTPVIFTKNQGFDGNFENGTIGYAVNATDKNEIISSIRRIRDNYPIFSKNCVDEFHIFDWKKISQYYINIYNS